MGGTKELDIEQHAIQLNYVGLKELHFESIRLPSAIDESAYGEPTLSVARSDYNEAQKTIQVFAKFELKGGGEQAFTLRVEIASEFRVDEQAFPKEKIIPWADRAAFYVLFPFLREQVYALAIRVGLKQPLMLPLMSLPTFKVERPVAERGTGRTTIAAER